MIHSYTAKPNIYGSIAARLAGVKRIYPTVNGLGYAFIDRHGFRNRALRLVVSCLYKFAFACAARVFFQNPDDMAEKMLWLLEHPEAVHEMGRKGREYAEDRFDVEKVSALILETMGM